MGRDYIVDEVRQAREDYARKFNDDLRAMLRDLKEQQKKSGCTTVKLSPKRLKTVKRSSS